MRINNRKNRIAAAFIWHVQSSGGNTFSFNPELVSKRGGLAWKNEALRRCKTRSRDRTLFPKRRKMEEFSSDIQHEQQWDPKRITKSNPFWSQMNGGIHKEQLFIYNYSTFWSSNMLDEPPFTSMNFLFLSQLFERTSRKISHVRSLQRTLWLFNIAMENGP